MCDTITYKQLKSLYLIVFIALNFLTFPSRLADTVKTDGVISIILVSAVAFLSVSATFKIMLSYKGKTFPEVLCELFGKKLGQFVNLIYLINLYVLFVYTLRLINEHIISYVLPEMQPFFVEGIYMLCVLFLTEKRLRTHGNMAQILAPWIVFIFLWLVLGIARSCDPEKMLPLFTSGLSEHAKAFLMMCAFTFSGTMSLPYVIPFVSDIAENEKRVYKDFLFLILAVCGLFCLYYTVCVSILGWEFCSSYIFPAIAVAQSDNAKNSFIERYEILLLSNVFMNIYIYQATAIRGIKFSLRGFFKDDKKAGKAYIVVLCLVFAGVLFLNEETIGRVIFRFIEVSNMTAAHTLLPFSVYAAYLIKNRRKKVQ